MKGLELAEKYFIRVGAPMIEARFPFLKDRLAAGLVGDGSECFGFDDVFSQDHDWGPGFCLWLTAADYEAHGRALAEAVAALPRAFAGIDGRRESGWGQGRVGVFEIGRFYQRFIGLSRPPATLDEWRRIPEESLAVATNGKVFTDPLGEFTRFRQALLAYYPEDVRLKKIAARCMAMAQSGQYNFMRSARREEAVAAQIAEGRFIEESLSMVFLLNRVYKPFYKWMHRALKDLPILGETLHHLLRSLVDTREGDLTYSVHERKSGLIEVACQEVIAELRRQGLSRSTSDFMLDHGPEVQSRIKDQDLKKMDVWVE
jgi:hypothetical protein